MILFIVIVLSQSKPRLINRIQHHNAGNNGRFPMLGYQRA
ncbi:hypothetical protein SPWS13_1892 [Shewanella putrefaciens]|nr:hypothetical protein SPWS13_1892 [Shewanella putrefaciens]